MRSNVLVATLVVALAGFAFGQQSNMVLSSYMVNATPSSGVGQSSPISVSTMTDTPLNLNVRGYPLSFPVVMLYDAATTLNNTIVLNAFSNYNFKIDLRDRNTNGYGDQILFDGFARPSPATWTDNTGNLSVVAEVPACLLQNNALNCITSSAAQQFEVSTQALVYDATNVPFNIRSTAATKGTFDNGYQQFSLSFDNSASFAFKQGFTFRFYGTVYSTCWVSANGFVSFGPTADTSFPSPTVSSIIGSPSNFTVPRIMPFYTDLEPQIGTYGAATRIYARQFTDSAGVRKVKFVHAYLAEFSDLTGPHGGECVITEQGDIAVYVAPYQTSPSINTAVGITAGSASNQTLASFGVDLSAKRGTNFALSPGGHGFEVFDHFNTTPVHPLDLIGVGFGTAATNGVGDGTVFLKNTALANTTPLNSGYIIQ